MMDGEGAVGPSDAVEPAVMTGFLDELRRGLTPDIDLWLSRCPKSARQRLRPALAGAVLFDREFRSFQRRYPGFSFCRLFGISR